jgi:hypothetical protein
MHLEKFSQQLFFVFNMLRVFLDAVYRAGLDALGFVIMADTFSAFVRIYFINFVAKINGFIRALGIAHVAVYAGV